MCWWRRSGLPVGLDDPVLSSGPIGVGRGVLAGRSVLDGAVPPFGVLATDGTRFAAQQDWLGMASIYIYRSRGVVAFSNRPILLPDVFGDAIHPDADPVAPLRRGRVRRRRVDDPAPDARGRGRGHR